MQPNANTYLRIGNDFLHDVAAGAFPGAVALAWMVRRALEMSGPGSNFPSVQVVGALWTILALGLAVSVTTGIFRLRYRLLHIRSEFHKARSETAFVKHTLFVLLLLGSSAVLSTFIPS